MRPSCLPLPVLMALDLDELIAGDNLLAIALALIVVGALFCLVENLREGRKPTVRRVSADRRPTPSRTRRG